MKIEIRDHNVAFCSEAKKRFADVRCGPIFDGPAEALVSPANSFGFMDGGIDAAYTAFFGKELEQRVIQKINDLPFGELLIGQALLVETHHTDFPYLVVAPTMRVPWAADPVDIMLSCRAAIHAASQAGIFEIVFPGMGTGCGRLRPDIAAQAMKTGMDRGLSPSPRPASWRAAQIDQHQLYQVALQQA